MIVKHKIDMDLVRREILPCINAVQDDKYSRDLVISLYENGLVFTPDEDCAVLVRYRKPDRTVGIYDTMPDGTLGWSIAGNVVTVALAPQVCTVPGSVELTVALLKGQMELSCFSMQLLVQPRPQCCMKSENYLHVTGFLPQPVKAEVGQYLVVSGVDEQGRVTGVEAVSPGAVTGGTCYVRISVSQTSGEYEADKTVAELEAALQAECAVICYAEGYYYLLLRIDGDGTWVFGGRMADGSTMTIRVSGDGVEMETEEAPNTEPDIPETLPNPFKLTFTGAVSGEYDGSSAVTVNIPAGSETVGDSTVASYVAEEAERVAAVVQGHQNENTISFLACSDIHYSESVSTAAQQAQSLLHCTQGMGLLRKLAHMDFGAMLGDMIWDGGESAADAMAAMRKVNRNLADAFGNLPGFYARGNHDCLYSDDTGLTDEQIFANVGARNTGAVYDSANRLGGYCYRDFESQKLRVICINTCENSAGEFAVSDTQISWLGKALDLSALGDGWQSIVLGHHPPDWVSSSSSLVQTLAAASGLLCVFHGHVHGFKSAMIPGTAIKRIAIPNACFGRENEYGQNGTTENAEGTEFGESTTYSKTASDAKDTSFCVVTIDPVKQYVYADHYGAGYDRVISLTEDAQVFTVTNNLTKVTTNNAATEATEGTSYNEELTFASGYGLTSITVTMGGEDVTDSAFYGGRIRIGSVTGDIVVTAKAEALAGNFTNLVPTSGDFDGDGVFNTTGYRDGCYVSSVSPYLSESTDGSVTSGLMEYSAYGADGTTLYQPPTIYIRGVAFDTANTHNRVGMFDQDLTCKYCPWSDYLLEQFEVEELGLLYYKLTPRMNDSGQNLIAAMSVYCYHIAVTGNGIGANLIVTLDEPIE